MKLKKGQIYTLYSQDEELYPHLTLAYATRRKSSDVPNGLILKGFMVPNGRMHECLYTIEAEDGKRVLLSRQLQGKRAYFILRRITLKDAVWILEPKWKWEYSLEDFERYINTIARGEQPVRTPTPPKGE